MAGDTYELEVDLGGLFQLDNAKVVAGIPRNRSKPSFNLTPAKAEIILNGQSRGFVTLAYQDHFKFLSDDPVVRSKVGLRFYDEIDAALLEEMKAGVCILKCTTIEVDKEAEAARKAEDFKKLQARRKAIMDELERKKGLND